MSVITCVKVWVICWRKIGHWFWTCLFCSVEQFSRQVIWNGSWVLSVPLLPCLILLRSHCTSTYTCIYIVFVEIGRYFLPCIHSYSTQILTSGKRRANLTLHSLRILNLGRIWKFVARSRTQKKLPFDEVHATCTNLQRVVNTKIKVTEWPAQRSTCSRITV